MVFRKAVESCCLKNLANKIRFLFILLMSLVLETQAQQLPLEGAELNSIKGLKTDLTRQCRVDSTGALWVCHNQGLQIFPSSNTAKKAIISTMKGIPTWDVAFYPYSQKSYTAVISFDSGLYIFNDLGQLSKRIRLTKTRALQWVNNKLYCFSGQGVFRINGLDTMRMTPPCEFHEQITSFFFWSGNFYACTYPSNRWIQFKENESGQRAKWKNESPWPITHSILSQKTTDSLLYLGSEGAYYVIDKKDQSTRFNLGRNKESNWTVWSIEQVVDQIYLALGNVHDLERGAVVRHNSSVANLNLSSVSTEPFIWGLSYDATQNVLWASSLGKGCFALMFPNGIQKIPFGQIYTNQSLVCIWNEQQIFLKNSLHSTWNTQVFTESVLDVQTTANRTFALTKDWLYEWSNTKHSFQPFFNVSEYKFNKLIAAGYSLILHRPYGEWSSIDINTKELEKWNKSSKQTSQFISTEEFVFAQEFNGSLHVVDLENRQSSALGQWGINANTPIAISNNIIIAQVGQTWKVHQFVKNQLTFLFDLNIEDFILPNQEFKLFGTSRGFWILSNSHLYQISISKSGSAQIIDQQYIGHLSAQSIRNSDINISQLWYFQSGFWKSIPLPNKSIAKHSHAFFVEHQNGERAILDRAPLVVQPLNDFNIRFSHPEYWTHYHGLLSLCLKNNQDSVVHRQVRSGQEGNWIPGIPSGDYALYLNHQSGIQCAFVKTNTKNGGLAMAVILVLVIVSTLVNFRDLSKSAENQLISLRWKTLKSNMNPHFLHNSMSLIQSLIANQESKKAIEVTGKIAEINRLFLETNLQELATLEKELEFCRKYIQIESMRFSDKKFKFKEIIDPKVDLREWSIPPLLFQPVIENAIKHGLLLDSRAGELLIRITQEYDQNSIYIEISNTGPGPSFKRSHGTQMGSQLVQERLEHFNQLYQEKFQAQASSGFDELQENRYVFTLNLQKT